MQVFVFVVLWCNDPRLNSCFKCGFTPPVGHHSSKAIHNYHRYRQEKPNYLTFFNSSRGSPWYRQVLIGIRIALKNRLLTFSVVVFIKD